MQNIYIGEFIRQRRKELNLSQEDLAYGICEVSTLSRIENGRCTPSRSKINALLQRLGLPEERYYAIVSKNEKEIEALKKKSSPAMSCTSRKRDMNFWSNWKRFANQTIS